MKPWTIGLAAGTVILAVAGCGSAARVSAAKSPSVSTTQSASSKPSSLPGLGQPARDGVYVFTVTKFECGLHELSSPADSGNTATPSNGQFCIAVVDEDNVSKSPQQLPFDASMTGTNGDTYANDTSNDTALSVADYEFLPASYMANGLPDQVNPGTVNPAVFLWDVPAGVAAASVTLYAPFTSTPGATIAIGR